MNRLQLVEVNLVPQVGVNLDWRTAEIPTSPYASGYDQHQLQVAALVRWEMRTLAIVLSLSLSDVGHHANNECSSPK